MPKSVERKKKLKPRGGRQIKENHERLRKQLLADSLLANKYIVHEFKEVIQPSGETVKIPVNIRLVDPPPPRAEDIFTEIESPFEFDCLFNTLLNNAQQKLDQSQNSRFNEQKVETIASSFDDAVEVIAEIPIIRDSPDNGIDIEEGIWKEIAQREIDDYSKSMSELESQ